MHPAIQENLDLLESCETFLGALPAAEYTRPAGVCFNGAIGMHLRHLLDHYFGFLAAMGDGLRVDYEARAREPRIEADIAFARELIRDVSKRLAELDGRDLDAPMKVRLEIGDGPQQWSDSSPSRELAFLVSHTVHHCALIGVICRANGVPVPEDFGVAPSTLRHRASTRS